MRILGIDTSCDDTCAAVVKDGKIETNIVSSQIDLHKSWGGVVPDIAKRAHAERILPVVCEALGIKSEEEIQEKLKTIDAIAVTQGPGLAVALGVGIDMAKKLAKTYNKKLVAVHHIEGHLLSVFLKNKDKILKQVQDDDRTIAFPALALTVSGGHTNLVVIQDFRKYELLGETVDDAAGEALDKASKILGLGYPGGAILEKLSLMGDKKFLPLPRPMRNHEGYNFSFAGLKTAFYYTIKDWSDEKKKQHLNDLAASYQSAVFDSLLLKVEKALLKLEIKSMIGVGGVFANETFRTLCSNLGEKYAKPVYFPIDKKLNTDNAAMIAYVGEVMAKRGEFVENIDSLEREPRMKLTTLI